MKKFDKPHFEKKRFYNDSNRYAFKFLARSVIMRLKAWWLSRNVKNSDVQDWFCSCVPSSCSINPVVTWLGHASFLIQVGGLNILTDPVLGEASFLYKRFLQPGIGLDKLPNIDFVLISHNHRDHMDGESLMELKKHNGICFLVPMGDKLWFDRRGFANVREYMWWQKDLFNNNSAKSIKFTFLPANHWSQRGFFDRNKSLWGSWMIEAGVHKIYFAGDSCYDSHFKEIAQNFSDIDVALLPIGPCEPREWVAHHHLDAKDAMQAFLDLKSSNFVPMHWGTFPLGAEAFDVPIHELKKVWKKNHDILKNKKLYLSKAGQPMQFTKELPEFEKLSRSKKSELVLEK